MGGISGISSMVSSLQQSIDAAVKRTQEEAKTTKTASADKVYEQNATKSSSTQSAFATNLGYLIKDKTRLNGFSILGANDPVDFYKFNVTSKGDTGLGRVGDDGVRVQLMNKTGTVMADSNAQAGAAYDAYTKWTQGKLTLDKGDYTIRVTREKGEDAAKEKQYALQLTQGDFTTDYDTYAKQPAAGTSGGDVPSYVKTLQSLMGGSAVTSSSLTNILLGGGTSSSSSSSYSSLLSGGRGSLLNSLL